MKKLMLLFFCLFISLALFSCTIPGISSNCKNHTDNNADAKCDNCGTALSVVCNYHNDANHDGVCDTAGGEEVFEIEHTDTNHNGICDTAKCRAIVPV